MRILTTGGSGFLGYHVAADLLANGHEVVALARLDPGRLALLPAVRRVVHDFRAALSPAVLAEVGKVDVVIHAGARVHALSSLADPAASVADNVTGTFNMLEAARVLKPGVFVYVSTCEVFGPTPEGVYYSEDDAVNPSTPYSATKAAGECLVCAYGRSFGLGTLVVRSMNLYGEHQQDTRFVPMVLDKILRDEVVDIHAYPNGRAGTRQWLYAPEFAGALRFLVERGQRGETYHVVGEERDNLEVARYIADTAGLLLRSNLVDVGKTHRAHDLRYAVSAKKIARLGWRSATNMSASLEKTVRWLIADRAPVEVT